MRIGVYLIKNFFFHPIKTWREYRALVQLSQISFLGEEKEKIIRQRLETEKTL